MADELSNEQVYDRLHAAYLALGTEAAASIVGKASIATAREALRALQMGLLMAMESGSDDNGAILDSSKPREP